MPCQGCGLSGQQQRESWTFRAQVRSLARQISSRNTSTVLYTSSRPYSSHPIHPAHRASPTEHYTTRGSHLDPTWPPTNWLPSYRLHDRNDLAAIASAPSTYNLLRQLTCHPWSPKARCRLCPPVRTPLSTVLASPMKGPSAASSPTQTGQMWRPDSRITGWINSRM
jgi:hypothetical protein